MKNLHIGETQRSSEVFVIYNSYKEFTAIKCKFDEACKKFEELISSNKKDFYFRAFNREFDYIFNYGEEIKDEIPVDGKLDEYYLEHTLTDKMGNSMKNRKVLGIKKEGYGSYLRLAEIKGGL